MTELPASLRGRVLVAGAGVSGRGCVAMLTSLGVDTTVADSNQAALEALAEDYGVATVPVDSAAQSEFDLVVTSPGWRPDSPLLVAFQNAGVEVIGDVELAYRLDRSGVFGAPRTWLVVTGTNGKTTTTGMLAKIMQADAARTHDFELFCLDEGEGLREFARWCAERVSDSGRHAGRGGLARCHPRRSAHRRSSAQVRR